MGRTRSNRRRQVVAMAATALVALALVTVSFVARATAQVPEAIKVATDVEARCAGDHWVGAWRGASQGSSLGRPDDQPWGDADGPALTFTDQTLRMVVTPNLGGSALRIHLGNRFGTEPVAIDGASVAVRLTGPSPVIGTMRPLTFGGARTVVIPAGATVVSDPVDAIVTPFAPLLVSAAVRGDAVLDHHQWSRTTSYLSPAGSGDHSVAMSAEPFTEQTTGWYGVTAVDVLAPRQVGAVVAFGDSITDGVGSTADTDQRWPDLLARRFAAAGVPLSVVNTGIAGNHVTTSGLTSVTAIGPSALDRLDVDALDVNGVTDVIVYEGINDIYMAPPGVDIVTQVVDGYEQLIARAHDAGARVIGATITPASLAPEKDAARIAINEWIRTSGAFDVVVDFDAVARDPGVPARLLPAWDAGLAHLTDAGYAALADAVPLDIFQGTGCPTR